MMNYLKKFESFQTNEEIHQICKRYYITNYTINSDGSIDVDDDVDLNLSEIKKMPLIFNKVSGNFDCSANYLTTLEGSPQSVGGWFNCRYNKLTTLKGAPQSVDGWFDCYDNKLTTLEGGPQSVSDWFDCSINKLTTLEHCVKSVSGFSCNQNKLTTLEGGPEFVIDYFDCRSNYLTTLKGAPQSVDRFFCNNNKELKSLEYLPKYINCEEVSFEFTQIYEVFRLLDNYSIGMIRLVNDLKVIVDDKIDIEKLNDLLYDQGKSPVENVKGYDNI